MSIHSTDTSLLGRVIPEWFKTMKETQFMVLQFIHWNQVMSLTLHHLDWE